MAVGRWFPLFQCRQQAKDALSGALRDVSMRVGAAWGGPVDQGVAGLGNRSDTAVGDLLVRLVTKGKAQMAEERVTDAGAERFLSGREAPFFESFVPHITRMLQDSGARQLVVVFKPRSYAEAGPAADSFGYYCDAIRFFQERQVDYIDFVADDLLGIEHYAAGDHYNNSGREYVSRAIGKKLASMLAEAIASKH
ncbi:MAG: hypothetical protein IH628_06555 [Proteobacteria bacterium]|nr:hypothetical protein [Pseudomonadota bacterium]